MSKSSYALASPKITPKGWNLQTDSSFTGPEPAIHLKNSAIQLHMYISMIDGIIDLFIGDDIPSSRIYLEIDASREIPIEVVRVNKPTTKQIRFIDEALAQFGVDELIRGDIRKSIHNMRSDLDPTITREEF